MEKSLIFHSQSQQGCEKGQFLRQHNEKGCFHRNSEYIVQDPFVDPLFMHLYPVGGQEPPPSKPAQEKCQYD